MVCRRGLVSCVGGGFGIAFDSTDCLVFYYIVCPSLFYKTDGGKTNAESLVGKQAIVIGEIDNLQGIGQVTVGGMEWSARGSADGIKLPVGSVVNIVAINGVKLIVEEKK